MHAVTSWAKKRQVIKRAVWRLTVEVGNLKDFFDPKSAVQAVERDLSIPVTSIITLVELQRFLEEQPSDTYDTSTLQSVIDYRKEYGAL